MLEWHYAVDAKVGLCARPDLGAAYTLLSESLKVSRGLASKLTTKACKHQGPPNPNPPTKPPSTQHHHQFRPRSTLAVEYETKLCRKTNVRSVQAVAQLVVGSPWTHQYVFYFALASSSQLKGERQQTEKVRNLNFRG